MKKIANVIDTCKDCIHCKLLIENMNNHTSASVCIAIPGKEFILQYSCSDKNVKNNHEHPIPENCPLEDYKNENHT